MKRRFLTVLLCLLLAGQLFPATAWAAEVTASGDCGGPGNESSVTWKLWDDGDLYISGTGAMEDFDSNPPPWHEYRESIQYIGIWDVTSIGKNAFHSCTNLTEVHYGGTIAQWETLQESIGVGNDPLLTAAIVCKDGILNGNGRDHPAVPTNLRWATERGTYTDESGTHQVYPGCLWFDDTVNEGEVFYFAELSEPDGSFPEGEEYPYENEVASYSAGFKTSQKGTIYFDSGFSMSDMQTGSYRFRLTAGSPEYTWEQSAPVYSDIWSYTRPSARLAVPTGLQLNGSKIIWNAVPNAEAYLWEIGYSYTADGDIWDYQRFDTKMSHGMPNTEGDASEYIAKHGVGYYHIRVRALSDDITKVCNSEWCDEVVVYSDGKVSSSDASTHVVTCDPNGGRGNMKFVTIRAGQSTILPMNTFTRTGYRFVGWNTAANGRGTSFPEGTSLTLACGLTLYAQWEWNPDSYGILDRVPDMYRYEDRAFRVDGPLSEFVGLKMDGKELTEGRDYTTAEDSTRINISASAFQNAGEGTHTIAALFRDRDNVLHTTEQEYTADLSGKTTLYSGRMKEAVRFVPYSAVVEAFPHYGDLRFRVLDGSLPDGWELDELTGEIFGVPQESDVTYTFTLGVSHGDGEIFSRTFVRVPVVDNTNSNVYYNTESEFRPSIIIHRFSSNNEVYIEFKPDGPFEYFKDFYLDGVKLERGADYWVKEDGKIICPKTRDELGEAVHTVAATFYVRQKDGKSVWKVSSDNFSTLEPRSHGGGRGGRLTAYQNVFRSIGNGEHAVAAIFSIHDKNGASREIISNQTPGTDEKNTVVPAPASSYAIHLKQVTGGTVRASAASARSGTKITLTLTPAAGYTVQGVTVTGTNVAGNVSVTKSGNQYTFTMPGKQVTVTPVFGRAARRIVATAVEHGKLTVQPASAVPGGKVTITALPDNGYVIAAFSAWDEKGQYLAVKDNGDGTATFTMPESPVQVGGQFQLDPGLPVTDIRPADWFYEDARWAYRRGIMTGVTGTTWVPEDKMSTATAVVTLARLSGADLTAYRTENWTASEENRGNYTWIPEEWYAPQARWAARNGILTEDVFTGREILPRVNLAVMLRRFLTQQGVTPETTQKTQTVFSDEETIRTFGPEAEDAFRVLYEAGVFRGDSTKAMLPSAATKRSHLAATLHRLSEYIIGYWEAKET